MIDAHTLREFFEFLKNQGFEFSPQTPDQLLKFRKSPESFSEIVKLLGLGLEVSREKFEEENLTYPHLNELVDKLIQKKFFSSSLQNLKSNLAISGGGDLYVVHDHWPPKSEDTRNYIHVGAESRILARLINRDLEGFIGRSVLDMGCSSGVLSFEVAGVADQLIGFDISKRSVEWANLIAKAYGFCNSKFYAESIGGEFAEKIILNESIDLALMNPPMTIPNPDQPTPHRDGGNLGIELPLLFLDYAHRKLKKGGQVYCLATSPVVKGKKIFFEELKKRKWTILRSECLRPYFNQNIARKHKYDEHGISQIELWYLELQKNL